MRLGIYIDRINNIRSNISNVGYVINEIIKDNSATLLELNKDQILSGVDSDESYFAPTYIADSYFKSTQKAINYMNWKERNKDKYNSRITHNLFSPKPADIPNLIVVGTFQNNMYVTTNGSTFTIGSTYNQSGNIESKYNNKVFGINNSSRDWFWKNVLLPGLTTYIYGV